MQQPQGSHPGPDSSPRPTATGGAFDPARPWESITLAVSGFGGDSAIGVVLEDWFSFLGGRPGEVVYVDGGSGSSTVRALTGLLKRGLIDRLELLNPASWENSFHRCYIQEHESGALARFPYILFIKPDVLPMRAGHDRWLAEDLAMLDRPEVMAITLTHLIDPPTAVRDGYRVHDFASLNFALMKRPVFRAAMAEQIGELIESGFRGEFPGHITCEEKYRRALIEWAWQGYCRAHGLCTLAREESREWTIFHVNKSGSKLLRLREKFHAGEDVERHFNQLVSVYRPAPRGLSKAGREIEGAVRGLKRMLRGKGG